MEARAARCISQAAAPSSVRSIPGNACWIRSVFSFIESLKSFPRPSTRCWTRYIIQPISLLVEQGMNVVSADNGRDAIRLLSEKSPVDIVLMDIMMPEMDGIDTMLEIR